MSRGLQGGRRFARGTRSATLRPRLIRGARQRALLQGKSMRWAMALFALVALLAGCSHVYPSDPASGHDVVAEVNRAVKGRTVDVTLSSGAELWAKGVEVTPDSTRLTVVGRPSYVWSYQTDIGSRVRNDEIRSVSIRRRGRGLVEGAAIGLVAGAAVGALLGARDPWIADVADGALVLGRIGLGVGLVWGGLAGSKDVYDFTEARKTD